MPSVEDVLPRRLTPDILRLVGRHVDPETALRMRRANREARHWVLERDVLEQAERTINSAGGVAAFWDWLRVSWQPTFVRLLMGTELGVDQAILDGALCVAAYHGDLRMMKYLIKRGAAVGMKEDAVGTTPLTEAAGRGHVEVMRWLISQGTTPSQGTWVEIAKHGQTEAAQLLIDGGAEVHEHVGTLMLVVAFQNSQLDFFSWLARKLVVSEVFSSSGDEPRNRALVWGSMKSFADRQFALYSDLLVSAGATAFAEALERVSNPEKKEILLTHFRRLSMPDQLKEYADAGEHGFVEAQRAIEQVWHKGRPRVPGAWAGGGRGQRRRKPHTPAAPRNNSLARW
jgi:hypothetical protein